MAAYATDRSVLEYLGNSLVDCVVVSPVDAPRPAFWLLSTLRG